MARAWLNFAQRLYRESRDDQVSNGAAALAFYSMLALFPAAILSLSVLPYLSIPHLQQAIFELLSEIMPSSAALVFTETVQRAVTERNGTLVSFGLVFTIWSGSNGLYAIMQQLNVVYGVKERRPFWRARALAAALMMLFFVLMVATFALVIFGGVLQDRVAAVLGWSAGLRGFFVVFRWSVIATAMLCAFAITYRIGPNAGRPFRLLAPGNVVAVIGLMLASLAFRTYVSSFSSYDATYGGLGGAIVLLLYLYLAGWVILVGAEVDNLLDRAQESAASGDHAAGRARQETQKTDLTVPG